jgi:hypothetical protein
MRTRAGRITGAPQVKAAAKRRLDQAAEALTNRLLSFALDQGVSDDDEVGCLVGRLICIPTQMSQPSITPAASSIVSSTTASLMMSAMRIRRNCRDLVRVGLINLTAEGMDGVVADAWAFGKPYSSGLDAEQWGVLFERNGFSSWVVGQSDRPRTLTYSVERQKTRSVGCRGPPKSTLPAASHTTG